jgi:hypothetical protein
MKFMAEKGWNMLRDPRSVPVKMLNYAKYDLVHIVNKTLDRFSLGSTMVGRGIQNVLAAQAAKSLRMKRSVSLLVADPPNANGPSIISGTYQSPILIQWSSKSTQSRRLEAVLYRFI